MTDEDAGRYPPGILARIDQYIAAIRHLEVEIATRQDRIDEIMDEVEQFIGGLDR